MNRFVMIGVLAALVAGCAGPKFAPPRYKAGATLAQLTTTNKVYLSRILDRLGEDNRKFIDPKFSTAAYLTDALQQELAATGLKPVEAPFAVGATFVAAQQTITDQANKQEAAVYIVGEVQWINSVKLTLDMKVYSPRGAVLFEKRGLCVMLNCNATPQVVTHMVMRQIVADPNFQKAIQ
jgi:hypothetical protein